MGKIKIIDGVYCKASRDLWPAISRLMEFEGERWKATQYGRTKEVKTRSFLDQRGGKFLCGFLPRVKTVLAERGVDFQVENPTIHIKPASSEPHLNLTEGTREDQLLLQKQIAQDCARLQRGVVLAPTGSGKTTIAMLLASMYYPKFKILFLCHTISLLTQTASEFKTNFKNVWVMGGTFSKGLHPEADITIATVQTFSKIPAMEYCDEFDVVLVDEAHHCNSVNSLFGKILTHSIAPVKIGFTATLPNSPEGKLALEGIIGPVVGKISIQQGVEMNIMAKPRIKLIPVPYNSLFGDTKKYADLYRAAIVESRVRNSLVANEATAFSKKGLSTLIIVKEILQGNNLVDILKMKGLKCIFVQGKTPGETREQVKKHLNQKEIQVVICTAVWKEGVNIPSLNCVINACGGKSEIATLQAIGRGLRSIPGKDTIIIVDFLDPYKYLAQHAIKRLSIYVEAGWL